MDFDQTQVLDLEEYLEETQNQEEDNDISRPPVGYLKVFKSKGFPETSFPVYEGDNLIGRDDRCNITIPTKPISKKHACIEVRDDTHLIYDCNSRNRTRRNKVFLKPQVRYELRSGDQLIFADVDCQYLLEKCKNEIDNERSETGSETGSESMLPESNIESEDLEPCPNAKKLTSSPKREGEMDESFERERILSTRESKNLGAISPVFCAETDSETDDEEAVMKQNSDKDPGPTLLYSSQENKGQAGVDSSFVVEQTLLYSQGQPVDNHCSLDATLPARVTVEPDTVPATPGVFAADNKEATPVVLKRAVDVKCDPFKRRSTGNTLDYGLETLENPNISRESVDTSGIDSIKDDLSREPSPAKRTPNMNTEVMGEEQGKDDEEETAKNCTTSPKTFPREDTVLDDLMATQVYETGHIPESPVLSDEYPLATCDGVEVSEEDRLEPTQAYGLTNNGSVPDEPTGDELTAQAYGVTDHGSVRDEPSADELATQVYGVSDDIRVSGEGTGDEMATQAYGLDGDSLETGEQTGDEGATQVYEYGEEDNPPREEIGDMVVKKSTAGHADDKEGAHYGETNNNEETLDFGESTLLNEYDTQATQMHGADDGNQSSGVDLKSPVVKINLSKTADAPKRLQCEVAFAETSDSDHATSVRHNAKPATKTDESSDSAELPSLASLGISMATEKPTTDSEEDFLLPGRRSSRKRTPSKKLAAEGVSSSETKSPSIVIEGENTLSGLKRCYVECTPEDKNILANKIAKIGPERIGTELKSDVGSSEGRTRGRGRRPSTRQQEKPAKSGRKGKGRRETDEMADGEMVEGDEVGELCKSGNSKGGNEEEDTKTLSNRKKSRNQDGRKTTNSENEKSKLNKKEVIKRGKEEEAGKKEKENQKKNKNKKSEPEEYKNEKVLPNDNEDHMESGKKPRGRRKKKSDVKSGEMDRNGLHDKQDNEKSKINPEQTGNMSERGEKNERLKCSRKETETEVNVSQLDEKISNEQPQKVKAHGHLGQENVKDVHKQQSDANAETYDSGCETGILRTGKGKKVGTGRKPHRKSKVVDGEDAQENIGNLEEMDEKRTARTKGRLGKRGAADEGRKEGSQKTGTMGRMEEIELAGVDNVEGVVEVEEGKDLECRTGRKGRTEIKESRKEKEVEDDIFQFNDHDKELPPKRGSVSKRQSSQASSAASGSGKKTRTGQSSRGRRRGKQSQETPKEDISSEVPEIFLSPEVTVTPSQRSRRPSTSSETSSQGTQKSGRGRKRDKKGKQGNSSSPVPSPDSVGTPSKRTKLDPKPPSNIKVLFTGLAQEEQARKIVTDLRGEVVESVYECTHLVTDKVRRTVKFLCALSRGIPVVDKRWLQACKKSKSFIDCSSFMIKDKASEKQYEFSLERSLELARTKGLLEGYQVHVTPSVVPKPEYMRDIIQCAKGEVRAEAMKLYARLCVSLKFQAKMPTSFSDHVLIVSCDEDKKLCTQALSAGHVHSSELLLTGVLRQELDTEIYRISEKESSTPAKKSSRRR